MGVGWAFVHLLVYNISLIFVLNSEPVVTCFCIYWKCLSLFKDFEPISLLSGFLKLLITRIFYSLLIMSCSPLLFISTWETAPDSKIDLPEDGISDWYKHFEKIHLHALSRSILVTDDLSWWGLGVMLIFWCRIDSVLIWGGNLLKCYDLFLFLIVRCILIIESKTRRFKNDVAKKE